jgi:nicotinamide-nucleotide amidase
MQMVEDTFIPFISSLTSQISSVSVVKLLTLGMGESTMAEKLEPLTWPEGITLGYRSYTPYLELKLIGRDLAPGIQDQAEAIAKKILADTIVANNQPSLASEVHRLLVNSGKTLSIAESLTGGEISSQLVALPGSSAYLKHAIVSYCNEAKINLLAVSPKTIEQHTEVSLACVAQMAAGVSKANGGPLSYDFSIATSGIAGPGGGTQALPVGTVVIALKTPQQIHCQRLRLSQKRSRQYIRELCVAVALDMLRRAILNLVPIADYGYIECAQQQIFEINDSLMG